MKVYCFPADITGCGYYRLIWAAEVLRAQGHHVEIIMPEERKGALRASLDRNGNIIDVRIPSDANVIVFQRITHKYLADAINIIRRRKVSVVVDMDDDLSAIHPANPAFMAMHPTYGVNKEHSWHNAQRACDNASFVTVSTDALMKRYVRHGRGMVLHNCVPQRYLDVEHADSTVIGWGGSVHSHPDDLQTVGVGVENVMNETTFRVVGPGDRVRQVLGLSREPEITGVRDMHEEWPVELARLGIGIAPLADTTFNSAKSHLKLLEYSALGVPWVASPRVEYRRFHELGAGILAEKPRQWTTQLRRLVRDDALRKELSEAGRAVARRFTIEGNAWRWLEAWESAYQVDH